MGAGSGDGRYEEKYIITEVTKMSKKEILFSEYPDVVSVEQLSVMLGIGMKTAYKLLKEKKIKSITIGRIYRIPKIYILDYLKIYN